MLLTVDIGNSNISTGVFQKEILRMKGKISVKSHRSADEYAAIFYDLLRMRQIDPKAIDGCILASVVPGMTGLVEEAVRTATGTAVLRVGPGIRNGFRIRIDDPSQLGGDLVADTLAGLTEYGAPLIIIDAGTATTIFAVDKDRTYLGGCILPGIRPSVQLLNEATALLPSIELNAKEESCLGRNSADAMRCGLLLGTAMMIDGFLDRYAALPGMDGAKFIATGGSAKLATARCEHTILQDSDLTLKGLRYLYESNRPKKRLI